MSKTAKSLCPYELCSRGANVAICLLGRRFTCASHQLNEILSNKKKKKEILSVKHLAGSPTCITGAGTAAISQAVAISMATLCDGYRQPHFTDEETDAQGSERTGPRWHSSYWQNRSSKSCPPDSKTLLDFSVLVFQSWAQLLESRCQRFKSQLCEHNKLFAVCES